MKRKIWRPLLGGRYLISNHGEIKSPRVGTMKSYTDKWGYACISLSTDGVQINAFIHRLVAEVFIGPSELEVNHINGIKTDNRVFNLEYVTGAGNMDHAKRTGLMSRGSKRWNSKLSEKDIRKIRSLIGTAHQKVIARQFSISIATVSAIKLRKTWTWLD